MEQYDLVVIGFGKAGKTLAGKLSAAGKRLPWLRKTLLCLAGLVSISAVFQPRPSW